MKQFKLNDEVFVLIDGEIKRFYFIRYENKLPEDDGVEVNYTTARLCEGVYQSVATHEYGLDKCFHSPEELLESIKSKYEESVRPDSKYEVGDIIYYSYNELNENPDIVVTIEIVNKMYNNKDSRWSYCVKYLTRNKYRIFAENNLVDGVMTEYHLMKFEVKPLEWANR